MAQAALILAAGSSSRLGRPKQLLPYCGKTLLRHTVDEAAAVPGLEVTVILGAHAEMILPSLAGARAETVVHAGWAEGMGSSLRAGVTHLLRQRPDVGGIVMAACDQPFVSAGLFARLLATSEEDHSRIVASCYADTLGIPAWFGRTHFAALQSLAGDRGAKSLLSDQALAIDFPEGAVDIDTLDDYGRLS